MFVRAGVQLCSCKKRNFNLGIKSGGMSLFSFLCRKDKMEVVGSVSSLGYFGNVLGAKKQFR